jgi:hypothetical protein
MWFLRDRLRFIESLYDSASEPFATKMRRITDKEPPFDTYDSIDPENDDPPFIADWIEAMEATELLGNLSLCLVQSALKQFLELFIGESGHNAPTGRGPWLTRYQQFFLDEYKIDWLKSPVSVRVLEDLSRARDGIQHGGTLTTRVTIQNPDYARRFTDSLFTEPFIPGPRIVVTRESLTAAVQVVEDFCAYLEGIRVGG